ncbi:MAG: putative lipid II flippase FtsW [Candidatus Berkelbacteria bacterium]
MLKRKSDVWLSIAVFALVAFGLIMIYSVSKYYSLQLTHEQTDKYFLKKQLTSVLIGLVVWVVAQGIDYRVWVKHLDKLFYVTIGLLLLPIILQPFGIASTGRWINLGFTSFQPAEVAKLTYLLYLCGWLANKTKQAVPAGKLFWSVVAILGTVAAIMMLQKDLGTLLIFVVITAAVYFASGAPVTNIVGGMGLGAFVVWLAIKIEPYRMQRFLTFLNPEDNALGSGYHIKNALIAIGSGGLWGLGFGQSKQKFLYLPEAHTDSIFAIIAEELGMVRSMVVIAVFVFIAFRGFKIAERISDNFGKYLAIGITSWIFFQMIINIGAMMSLVPLTGIPLPFISYGGTSMIVLLAAVGILTNISKSASSYEK